MATTKVVAKRGATVEAEISIDIRHGYHVNSHKPNDDYLIPLRLTWTAAPLAAPQVAYPAPQLEKYEFSDKPLSVFTDHLNIASRFQVPADAPRGPNIVLGKLRYQACTAKTCLPPKTVEVRLPIEIR